jgi:hypothetical protein
MLIGVAASGAWPTRSEEPSGHDAAVAFLPEGFDVPKARSSRIVVGVTGGPRTSWTTPHSGLGRLPGYDATRAGGIATGPEVAAPPAYVPTESMSPGLGDFKIEDYMNKRSDRGLHEHDRSFYDPSRIGGVAGKPSALPRWTKPTNGDYSAGGGATGLYEPARAGGDAAAPAVAAAPQWTPMAAQGSSPGATPGVAGLY